MLKLVKFSSAGHRNPGLRVVFTSFDQENEDVAKTFCRSDYPCRHPRIGLRDLVLR